MLLLCIVSASLFAQEPQQTESIDEGAISDQFDFVIRNSYNYKDENGQSYEVVKRNMMATLKAHTLDSLNAIHLKLDNTNKIVSDQKNEISTLKTDLSNTQEKLASTIKEKDSIALLGIRMSKMSYNLLMWSIIAALSVFLLTFIYRFKNSTAVTKAAKNRLREVENEFNEYRRAALAKEQKIRRQLQDEINKQSG
jgi:septal ring factor EnvC (AmiA/AmiB activator)